LVGVILVAVILITTCASSASSGSSYKGDGGKDTSIAVLVPEGKGIGTDQNYLPTLVQGILVGDVTKYSAMSVLDRQNLDKLFAETLDGIYVEDNPDIIRLGYVTHTDYIMTGSIAKTDMGYALQLQVASTKDGMTKASYTGNCSIAEFNDFTGVHKASLELLTGMGITLTDKVRQELSAANNTQQVEAQTALAQGITAQRQGAPEIAALVYYNVANAFDPSLLEAVGRMNVVNANIISAPMTGNIAQDVQNEIAQYRADQQWKRDWTARLTETEQYFNTFFNTSVPSFGLFYSRDLKRGQINFQNETVPLSFDVNLHSSYTWFASVEKALQSVYDGLNKTGRKQEWGLSGWPGSSITSPNPFAGSRKDFTVVFELVNERQQVIGSQSLTLGNRWSFSAGGERVSADYTENNFQTVTFNAVKANDITNSLTIRVASVNGISPQTALQAGSLRLMALNAGEWAANKSAEGVLSKRETKPEPEYDRLVILAEIWGDPVTSIADNTFRDSGLTRVTIPNSIKTIGRNAFSSNRINSIGDRITTIPVGITIPKNSHLLGITIPDGVTAIGDNAFRDAFAPTWERRSTEQGTAHWFGNGKVYQLVIPDSVTAIGEDAFTGNFYLNNIVIGSNVTTPTYAISDTQRNNTYAAWHWRLFCIDYNQNGRKAGTYTPKKVAFFGSGSSRFKFTPRR
jgi:hypothetical protein